MISYQHLKEKPDRVADGFQAFDVHIESDVMNVSLIQLKGRHPYAGCFTNEGVEMSVLVLRGDVGYFELNDKQYNSVRLREGSVVKVPKGVRYFWIAHGEELSSLHVTSSPPWTPEQHKTYGELFPS